MAGWEGWEGWEGWSQRAQSPERTGDGGNPTALIRGRELILRGNVSSSWQHRPDRLLRNDGDIATGRDVLDISQIARTRSIIFDICSDLDFRIKDHGLESAQFVLKTRLGAKDKSSVPFCKIKRPNDRVFAAQTKLVESWASARSERLPEIVDQMGVPMALWSTVVDLNPTTTPRTLQLLDVCVAIVAHVVHRIKLALHTPRPVMRSPFVQPFVQTPRFGALPGGHAAEAYLIAIQSTRIHGLNQAAQAAVAPAGVWKISVSAPSCVLNAWIERDDIVGKVPRDQQARFVGASVEPESAPTAEARVDERSTLSSIANAVHERLYVVGSIYAFPPVVANGVSPYTASGPSIATTNPRVGPDLSARADVAPALHGVVVDGVRSGDTYRSSGTSVAAGIAARYLLHQISMGANLPPRPTLPLPRRGTTVP